MNLHHRWKYQRSNRSGFFAHPGYKPMSPMLLAKPIVSRRDIFNSCADPCRCRRPAWQPSKHTVLQEQLPQHGRTSTWVDKPIATSAGASSTQRLVAMTRGKQRRCGGQGRRPGQKSRGDNTMLYCTSMYAVHEYQTSKAIIESNFGGIYDASLFLYSFFIPPFCPTFFKTRSLALIAGVCCKFSFQWVRAKPGR